MLTLDTPGGGGIMAGIRVKSKHLTMLQKKQMTSPMKKLYLDTEQILYRLSLREGMVTLAGYPG